MEMMGLLKLGTDTRPDDPAYLRILEAQKRWLAVNPGVSDIYSALLTNDDRVLLIADSETDYDGNGQFNGAKEQRVPIGTELEDTYGEFHGAMTGNLRFGEHPHEDAWGFWVSAYVSLGNNHEGLPVMIGVDYRASEWLQQILAQRLLVLTLFGLLTGVAISVSRSAREARADVVRERNLKELLQAASETAEAASMAKGSFLASMSHEIRTPMNGVLGMLELVRGTPLNDDQRELIDTAFDSGKSLLQILNDILDYSKAEAGMLHVESVDCNLRTLVTDITSLHTAIARSRGLSTSIHIAPDVPPLVRCDPFRLRQVLNNLISNALKFTTEGGISLMVERNPSPENAPEGLLRFSVRDSGMGVLREQQSVIFEPFTQGDQSTSRKFGGTGLGLAICKRLVTMMGGQIGVDSAEGIGSIFWFTLPLEESDARDVAEPGSPSADASVHTPPPASTAPPRDAQPASHPADATASSREYAADVLIVEDNEVNQLVTTGMLRRLGYTSEIAADGHSALEKLGTKRYGVVLMDMQMPGMDGVEATRAWREREDPGSRLPIIAMTANVLSSDREICIDAGMDDFIGKPVHMDELRSKLERNLGTTQVYS
jgi:signal transduction histidine kinase/CheY-like chemotaxis protein